MKTIENELHHILTSYRIKRQLTQEEVGEKIGVTKQAINNYEAGSRLPDWNILQNLVKTLTIPLDVLFSAKKLDHKTENDFFSKMDFLRFCAVWEWDATATDLDFSFLVDTPEGMEYTVTGTAGIRFQFILYRGQICWNHSEWDAEFVALFDGMLDDLKQKILYASKETFLASYEEDRMKKTLSLTGYSDDGEEELFALLQLHLGLQGNPSSIDELENISFQIA